MKEGQKYIDVLGVFYAEMYNSDSGPREWKRGWPARAGIGLFLLAVVGLFIKGCV